jgi:hypothetical protein
MLSSEGLTILPATTQDDVVDPVGVVLHRSDIGLFAAVAVPYSDDSVSPGRVKPVEVRVVLQRIHSSSVLPLGLISDHERHLKIDQSKRPLV